MRRVINDCIPKTAKTHTTNCQPLWLTPEVKDSIKKKHNAWNQFKRIGTTAKWEKVNRNAKMNEERSVVMNIKGNPKNFWKLVQGTYESKIWHPMGEQWSKILTKQRN